MIYEIRPMSFGELLDTGFRLLRNHAALLIGLAVVLYVPLSIVQVIVESAFAPAGQASSVRVVIAALVLGLVWLLVVVPVSSAAITHAVSELYLGGDATVGGSLKAGWEIYMPAAGTMLVMGVMVLGGFLLLIIPGIYLMLSYSLVWPVMVIERQFGMAGLRRSQDLARGNLGRIVGLIFVVGIFVSVVSGGLHFLLGYVPFVGVVVSGVMQGIGAAFNSVFLVLLYFDVRCRKEAFDLEHLAQLVERGTEEPLAATM